MGDAMTVTTAAGIEYRLPHTIWRTRKPVNAQDRAEAAIETLVSLYGQYDEEALLTLAHEYFCPHLSWSQFMDRIERLCAISCDVADHEDREPAWQAYRADYELELTSLVTRPDTLTALVDVVQTPAVDELAAHKARKAGRP
jgi:hypothetical protein